MCYLENLLEKVWDKKGTMNQIRNKYIGKFLSWKRSQITDTKFAYPKEIGFYPILKNNNSAK